MYLGVGVLCVGVLIVYNTGFKQGGGVCSIVCVGKEFYNTPEDEKSICVK